MAKYTIVHKPMYERFEVRKERWLFPSVYIKSFYYSPNESVVGIYEALERTKQYMTKLEQIDASFT